MIRHQLEEFCGRAPKRRKRYCYPGAKIDDITKALEDITEKEKHDSLYIVHVGTNDVKNMNSEELLEKYKRLIGTLKEKRSKFIVSGILPRIGAEKQFYNKAFSTNDRLKSLCLKENVEFINLWNHFYDQQILFNHDGLHLNPVGSARFGRLLNNAVEAHRTKKQGTEGVSDPLPKIRRGTPVQRQQLKVCLVNARSLRNKFQDLAAIAFLENFDIIGVTES